MTIPEQIHVSYSQLALWRTCRRKWYFRYVEGLEAKDAKPPFPLLLGSAVHEALDHYYEPSSPRRASRLLLTYEAEMKKYKKDIEDSWGGDESVMKDYEFNYDLGFAMMQNYAYEAPKLDDFEVLHTEHLFEIPVGVSTEYFDRATGTSAQVPLFYKGRIDGIIRLPSGVIALLEHKTAKQFMEKRLILDQQATSYMWAAREIFGLPVEAVVYNILRKQFPGPRVKAPLIYRLEAHRSEAHIKTFPLTVAELARDMELASKNGLYYHNPSDACSWCEYLSVCSQMQDSVDPELYLEKYFARNGGGISSKFDLESLVT